MKWSKLFPSCPTGPYTELVMLSLVAQLTSCGTAGHETKPAPQPVIDPACAAFSAIYVSRDDVLTDGTAKQILVHNETWKRLCQH